MVYLPALELSWIWDDDQYVFANPLLRTWDGLFAIWFRPSESPQYYPLVFSVLWVQFQLFGAIPLVYHALNVILHAANAVLCLFILRQLRLQAAIWIALAFALHPIQVESVAWVSELKNLLSGLFYAVTWLLLWPVLTKECDTKQDGAKVRLTERRASATNLTLRLAFAWLAFAAALLSKSVTATLPAAMLMCLWYVYGRVRQKQILCLVPMLMVGCLIGWNTARLELLHVGAEVEQWAFSFTERVGIAARSVLHYGQQVAWPIEQIFFYPRFDPGLGPQSVAAISICATVAGLIMVLAYLGKRGPFAGIAFFVGSALPALGFLNVYPHRFSFVADHFVYIPIVGLLSVFWSFLLWLVDWLQFKTAARRAVVVLPLILLLGYYAHSVSNYLPVFATPITLWEDTINKNPSCVAAMQNLGLAYADAGRTQEALRILKEAAEHDFDRYQTMNSIGIVEGMLGQRKEAKDAFLESTRLNPDSPRAWVNLGNLILSSRAQEPGGDWKLNEARAAYQEAWGIQPDYLPAFGLGTIFYEKGDLQESAKWFARAAEQRPQDLDARFNLAQCYFEMGESQRCRTLCQQLLQDYPEDPQTKDLLQQLASQ